jgi:hypothetical protein
VGKRWLKERCGLEPLTNFFPFKKSPKTECGLDSGADYILEYMVIGIIMKIIVAMLIAGVYCTYQCVLKM